MFLGLGMEQMILSLSTYSENTGSVLPLYGYTNTLTKVATIPRAS